MEYYSRTKPSLIENNNISESFKPSEPDLPLKDYLTYSLTYIYDNLIKDNVLWFIIIVTICIFLYYRHMNKRKKEKYDQRLTVFNPLQRYTNAKVNYLPTKNYNLPEPKPFPAMNHTPYFPDRAFVGKRYYTGTVNPYEGHSDTTIEGVYGAPDYITTTASFGDYAVNRNVDAVVDYKDIIAQMNTDLIHGIRTGPDNLMGVTEFQPPYAQ